MPAPVAVPAHDALRGETFTITELADEFALTTRAIRFYEDQGLLAPQRRGTRRLYTPRERVRLKLILRGKRLGMSLAEIAEILDLYAAGKSERSQLEKLLETLSRRRAIIEQQREDIDVVLAEIAALEKDCRKRLKRGAGGD
ncbi:MAG: MerR family DNA-binding transcriptional regulator [Burkholderiales bacterium]|nr:MerR family DNA-binding transcriptional regulator [Burkholderiales bacterium]